VVRVERRAGHMKRAILTFVVLALAIPTVSRAESGTESWVRSGVRDLATLRERLDALGDRGSLDDYRRLYRSAEGLSGWMNSWPVASSDPAFLEYDRLRRDIQWLLDEVKGRVAKAEAEVGPRREARPGSRPI
jgi:hypothetical protein